MPINMTEKEKKTINITTDTRKSITHQCKNQAPGLSVTKKALSGSERRLFFNHLRNRNVVLPPLIGYTSRRRGLSIGEKCLYIVSQLATDFTKLKTSSLEGKTTSKACPCTTKVMRKLHKEDYIATYNGMDEHLLLGCWPRSTHSLGRRRFVLKEGDLVVAWHRSRFGAGQGQWVRYRRYH